MREHGLRDMIVPEMEVPIDADRESGDRRQALRYERDLAGLLKIDDDEHPVRCLDIGYGGIRVVALDGVVPELGDLAEIEVCMGDDTFRDDCLVVETAPAREGTMIHLAM